MGSRLLHLSCSLPPAGGAFSCSSDPSSRRRSPSSRDGIFFSLWLSGRSGCFHSLQVCLCCLTGVVRAAQLVGFSASDSPPRRAFSFRTVFRSGRRFYFFTSALLVFSVPLLPDFLFDSHLFFDVDSALKHLLHFLRNHTFVRSSAAPSFTRERASHLLSLKFQLHVGELAHQLSHLQLEADGKVRERQPATGGENRGLTCPPASSFSCFSLSSASFFFLFLGLPVSAPSSIFL